MSHALPADLISPSIAELNRAADDNVRFTSPEDLHRFWKVYAVQRNYVNDLSVPRLRNLFWRIWSSNSLAESISNDKLNELWWRCRRGDPIAPLQIPLLFQHRSGQTQTREAPYPGGNKSNTYLPSSTARRDASVKTAGRTVEQPAGPGLTSGRAAEQATGQVQSSQPGRDGSSNNSTGSAESSSRPGIRRSTSGNKTRPTLVASGSRGRTKPSLVRRKSSQGKSQQGNAARPSQPALRSPTARTGSQEDQGGGALPSNVPPGSEPPFALPSASSWQSVDDFSPKQTSIFSGPPGERTGSLVDRDFRTKFLSTAINLPALGPMRTTGSVVRFADEEEDGGKGKAKEEVAPDSPESLRSHGRTGSQAIDSDDSDEVQLPRTTSQLSMAIKDRRKQSGSRDLGPGAGVSQEPAKNNETKRREQELLTMGRRAGAPHIPKSKTGSGEDKGYRPPSPGPTF